MRAEMFERMHEPRLCKQLNHKGCARPLDQLLVSILLAFQ